MIEAKNISKSFGTTEALKGVSFSCNSSEIFGFIGPDGAGKTTLFRILTTLLLPDSGEAKVFGFDPNKDYREIRKITGYMPGRFSLYQDLTVEENLNFYAGVFGVSVKDNYHLVSAIYSHIEPFKKRKAGDLSGGMKQKLALSCALIHNPKLIVLDEPTTGVDAVSRTEFWDMLLNIRERGVSILVSTPYMDEAMRCDRVALIDGGLILATGEPEFVRSQFEGRLYAIKSDNTYNALKALKSFGNLSYASLFGDSVHLSTDNETEAESIASFLKSKGIPKATVKLTTPGMEDRFLQLTQQLSNG